MATSFRWVFELFDKVSRPARAMGDNLRAVVQQIEAVDRALAKLESRTLRVGGGASPVDKKLDGLAALVRKRSASTAKVNAELEKLASGQGAIKIPKLGGTLGNLPALKRPEPLSLAGLSAPLAPSPLRAFSDNVEKSSADVQKLKKGMGDASTHAKKLRENVEALTRQEKVRTQLLRSQRGNAAFTRGAGAFGSFPRAAGVAQQLQRNIGAQAKLGFQRQHAEEAAQGMTRMGEAASFASGPIAALLATLTAISVAAVALGGAGMKFATDSLAFKESTIAGLKVMMGTQQEADKIFAEALAFAKKTPFDTKAVVEGYVSLMGAGFDKNQVGKVFSAIGDVSAMSGFDQQVIDRLTLSFSQIKAKGRLQGEEMLQVLEASGKAGVGATAVYEKIAKKLGIATGEVHKAISMGKVDSDTGILAILEAIQDRSGGKVGAIMLEQSKSLKGLMSTLSSAPGDFFFNMDVSKVEGFQSLKGIVGNLVQLFDSSSTAGQRLTQVVTKLYDAVIVGLFGDLGKADGLKVMESVVLELANFVDNYASYLKAGLAGLRGFISGFWEVGKYALKIMSAFMGLADSDSLPVMMEKLGRLAGYAAGAFTVFATVLGFVMGPVMRLFAGVMLIGKALDWLWQTFTSLFSGGTTTFGQAGFSWGTALIQGLVGGLMGGLGTVFNAISGVVGMVVGTYQAQTQTHSPSRLFESFGRWAVEGYAMGLESMVPRAMGAMGEVADVGAATLPEGMGPGPEPVLPSGMGGPAPAAGSVSLSIGQVVFQATLNPGDPESRARVMEEFESMMQELLGRMARRAGAA